MGGNQHINDSEMHSFCIPVLLTRSAVMIGHPGTVCHRMAQVSAIKQRRSRHLRCATRRKYIKSPDFELCAGLAPGRVAIEDILQNGRTNSIIKQHQKWGAYSELNACVATLTVCSLVLRRSSSLMRVEWPFHRRFWTFPPTPIRQLSTIYRPINDLSITYVTPASRVRTKTVKRASRVLIEKYYPRLTLDFQ